MVDEPAPRDGEEPRQVHCRRWSVGPLPPEGRDKDLLHQILRQRGVPASQPAKEAVHLICVVDDGTRDRIAR